MRMFLTDRARTGRRRYRRSRAGRLLLAGAASLLLSGCATTKAAAVAEGPPLAVSPPPPRVVVPPEEEPLAATGNGPDTPLLTVPRAPQQTPPPRRPATVRDAEPRNETPAVAAGGAVGPSAPPAEAPRELRPVPSPSDPALDEASVRAVLEMVKATLRGVDPGKLSTDAKRNYNEAKRLATQADEKLKERNLVFARDAANKALTFAMAAVGR